MILVFVLLFSSVSVTGTDVEGSGSGYGAEEEYAPPAHPASEVSGFFEDVRFLLTFPSGTNVEDGARLQTVWIHPDSSEYRSYTAAVKEGIDLRREAWAVEDGDFYSASIVQPDGSIVQPDRGARLEIIFPADSWVSAEPDNVRTVFFRENIFEEKQERLDAAERTSAPPMTKQLKDDGLHITFDLDSVYAFGVMKTQVPDGTPIEYFVPAEPEVPEDGGEYYTLEDAEQYVYEEQQTEIPVQEEMLSEEGIIPEGNEEYFGMTEPDEQWDYSAEVEEPVYSEEEIATEEAAGDPEETYMEENPAIPEGETLAEEPAIPEEVDITEEDSAIPEETFAEEDPVNPEEELFIEEEPVDPEEENLGEENLEYSEETSEEELPEKAEEEDIPEEDDTLSVPEEEEPVSGEAEAGYRMVPVEGADYMLRVEYSAAAGLPAEAVFEAKAITEDDKELWLKYGSEATRAVILSRDIPADETDKLVVKNIFDLTIYDPAGQVIEPMDALRITVDPVDTTEPVSDAYAVHFPENGTQQVIPAVYKNGTAAFSAYSFSVYAIVCSSVEQELTESLSPESAEDYPAVGVPGTVLEKRLVSLEGSRAYWQIDVNADSLTLNGGSPLTLKDTFTDNQSIDYASITVSDGVTYDYSGRTGTFVIPDETPATIAYRTRIVAQPGEVVDYGNNAQLLDSGSNVIDETAISERSVIYPSASDVAGNTGTYMVRVFAYGNENMQTGIPGAHFILLDANGRPMSFKKGDNAGEPVTFITDSTGFANIQLDEEDGDVSIEKNTAYYLEMIQAPEGYSLDSTLYSFMITDDPGYDSGSVWTYHNGDTLKVRLYREEAGLNVSMRFSGNYSLNDEQKNNISVVLQKKNGELWDNVEVHSFSEFSYGSFTFNTGKAGSDFETGAVYRVIEMNQRPWDLESGVDLTATYYLIVGSGESVQNNTSAEFTVTDENAGSSFNVVIDNEYEEHKLSVTKMDKETGTKLAGAVFTVRKANDETEVKTYTTDGSGEIIVTGGSDYESETLYYIVETAAPEGYLLPVVPEKNYFYFCNDTFLIPTILADLPEGETAVNLSESYESLIMDNQKKSRTIPVMKTWQGNAWPENVDRVEVGLYQSVDGGEPTPVLDDYGASRMVVLSRQAPYNNTSFTGLPARDEENRTITYSIKEEHVYTAADEDIRDSYVQEYGVSDAGVYIVRNRPAVTLTVNKEWYDLTEQKVTEESVLRSQSAVSFDIYQSNAAIPAEVAEGGITNEELESLLSGMTLVRSDLSFGNEDGWSTSINDLVKQDDLGNPYYYYVLETVPSFGTEVYEADENAGTVIIKNKVAPEPVNLTVTKAALVDDPRVESLDRPFEFTLKLQADETHPIRSWQVYTDEDHPEKNLVTDWNGEATFTLKPTNPDQQPTDGASITLSLPAGVIATVTEAYNPEYTVNTASTVEGTKGDNGRTFSYETSNETDEVTLTYTNNLRVVCKVVQDNGVPIPFETLKRALEYIRSDPESFTAPWTIYMLEDYAIPATDGIDLQEGESLTLTTASTTDDMFPFKGGEEADRAVITRGEAGDSMLKNAGTLTLEKICLDGGDITAIGDGGLVNSTGTLNLNDKATLRNSATSGKGGAVYAEGTVNIADGAEITGSSAPSASALYLKGTLNMTGGSIIGNTGASDGAVVVESTGDLVNLSGNAVIIDNTNTQGKAANLFIGVASDNIVNVVDPGLTENAQIGVTAMDGHMLIGEQFATAVFGQTDNLNRFINDVYGYRGKLKDGTSTNVVWDGLTVTIKKVVDPVGANPNDRFTITLSSNSIVMSTYIINGTLDYTVMAARQNRPGRITLRNVKADDVITISPLPVGAYTIAEAESNYTPGYTLVETGSTDAPAPIEDGAFNADNDSTVTVTNTRKQASVKLTKTLDDRLAGNDAVDFTFTVKLTEADGTAVAGFALAEGITTNEGGVATFTMSPTDADNAIRSLLAPVGASMTVTETLNSNYRIMASAKTMPTEGEGAAITDADTDSDNVFTFTVTEDGADVTFANVRKMAEIELSKTLVGKVSKTEAFTFTLTLTNDTAPVADYIVYRDETDPENNITTDANGVATVTFTFGENETEAKSIPLTIPEGTKLVVTETNVNGHPEFYTTAYSVDGGSAATGTTATIAAVSDADKSIAFTNTRKMQTITVTNTVAGYAGNVVPFSYTATVTDGGENQDDYDLNGFTDGVMTFELTTGQQNVLTVPYGATLTVTEGFIVGYETTVKRGNTNLGTTRTAEFQVTDNLTVAFTNSQLIGLRLINNTSSTLENVQVYVGYGTRMYRVNDAGDDQTLVPQTSGRWATLESIEAGKTALLEIMHKTGVTDEQDYTVKGTTPAVGYYYTINNEPSFHETANPAILRVYDAAAYEVKGKLRYSVNDSTVTFTEQPLVSFDSNGGSWTTEMDGYRDRDGDRKVYQKAVNSGETVARPTPDPVYPTAEGIAFLGWTTDETYAKQAHTESDDVSEKLYDFNTSVTAPFTLYAIWARDPGVRTVTVKNGLNTPLTVTVTLTNDDPSGANYTLYEDTVDSSNNITTDASGAATFTLAANETRNLYVPDGAKLVISGSDGIAYSSDYTDTDSDPKIFTIDKVQNDGTVAFIGGIFKITDAAGNLLYDANGRPAVYGNLRKTNNANPDEAFDAYEKTLYTDASHTTEATPAAVKQLVDEYTIPNTAAIAFPNMTMTLTTAGKSDTDFPYVGVRERATIYRSTAGANANCFTLASGNITLTEITLDGGSENGVKIKIAKTANGGLIYMNNASGVLNVTTGTTMRNCEFAAYDDSNNSRGGAIYQTNGTLNVNAGLFSNLHAYQGGAICVTGGTLNVTGKAGSTQFEDCRSERQDGGAICYKSTKDLLIDGGTDKNNPGIIFTRCVAAYTNGQSDAGDGGAIFAYPADNNTYKYTISVKGCSFIECSAKTGNKESTSGYGGGGICAFRVKGLTVEACTFESCDTLCGGGAVAAMVKYTETVDNETVTVKNCSFNQCNCKGQGGALGVYQDNNGAKNSATKLSIIGSSFTGCSSGTNNGSGGAIQCYLPCMVFTDSSFTDCWAGKEGGAVNNFFDSTYTAVWSKSFMTVDNCRFIRCRAEDRYDTAALQHYGGGINTKAKTVTVTGSYFEDCVSTLREGGALHIGGQGGGSKATITGSTFKNCTAKNGGGALLSSHETLTIETSNFYGCESSVSNGGAVYHTKNSRGDSTQNTTTITGCTFGADPDDSVSLGCSAANNGGAIWTRADTASITGCTISDCAANNGGAVYLDTGVTKATITDGSIKNCRAVSGSAVYVGKNATFSGSLNVSGNAVSDVNSGAIRTVNTGKLYFEGNVKVENNTCSADSTNKHDVLMQKNGVDIIYTTANGLGSEAHIGVYVPDQYFNNRGLEGQAFGTYGSSNYLDAFFNNRNGELYGCQMSADDTKIYWGNYVCKITDADGNTLKRPNGRDAVYQRLSQALDEFTQVKDSEGVTGKAVYIKMLIEDYTIRQTGQIENFPAADITLTTETYTDEDPVTGKYDGKHPYRGTPGSVCTISRTNSNNQLFKLNTVGATFRIENITLDGRKDKTTTQGNYRLIEAAAGALVINGGTTLQYGTALHGGAIDAAAAAQVTVNGVYDSANKEPTVKFINCTATGNNSNRPNGGAIRAVNLNITNSSENTGEFGTAFINCSAYNGGAITSTGTRMAINGAFFDSCRTQSAGGAVYHNYSDANSTSTFKNCAFENCLTNGNTWAHGGAIEARTAELSVEDCSFKNCSATSDGGAVYHGYVDGNNKPSGNREKTTIKNTTFDDCSTTGSDTSYNYGGSVYTQAKTVEVIDSSFKDSTATNHGGALYCQSSVNSSEAIISGTSFTNCASSRSGGYGGAIYSRNAALTLQKSSKSETSISNCTAPGYSGAVHMATNGSILNITDSTLISACYADKGGAIYLPAGVTMNLTGSPEFSQNGYTTQNGSVVNASEGACIYLAQGSRINLQGSPKFSRNILPTLDRINNGGILDYVRQDVYLAGYESDNENDTNAASIYVVGELTGDTIWVWPEKDPHRLPNKQFAKIADGVTVSEDTLSHFRNALADTVTGCSHGEYLAGVQVGSDIENVYWDKMYVVSFMKKDNKGIAVPDAEFTLYSDSDCKPENIVATAISADGEKDTDTHGTLLIRGTVEFTSIRIGAYYMKETVVPTSFKENNTTYLVLVGSPYLERSIISEDLWKDDGPLNVADAETLVPRHTTDVNRYYGIFPLDANGKAVLRANLASSNVGIENIRNDYQVSFMKVDGFGKPLPGAAFTIYAAITDSSGQPQTFEDGYPMLMRWSRDGENYPAPVVAADGTNSFRDVDNRTLPKGVVYIRELPLGTYYLLETAYPERNGDGRRTYYEESDCVFRLVIEEDLSSPEGIRVTISRLYQDSAGNSYYQELDKNENGYYVVSNREVVCKLTDADDNLLYVKGHTVWERNDDTGTDRVFPAVYSTLEEGFAAAQDESINFVYANGEGADVSSLKLKVLKDFTINKPITYSSPRALTFTTAETRAQKDRYVFSTTRTSDASRAEIKRSYSGEALITVSEGASLTLQAIKLNGQKSRFNGRAIHVTDGSLTVLNNTQLLNFKQNADMGGAILQDNGTRLTVNGGSARSALFSNNETAGADGGAIAVGDNCIVSITNAQFTGNKADTGNGGALSISAREDDSQEISLLNVVFRTNTAKDGGAIYTAENISLAVQNNTFTNNRAIEGDGGAIMIGGNSTLTLKGGTMTGNTAQLGSAIYAADHAAVTISGGSVTGNKAGGEDGGAINVGGADTRIIFSGSPVVFNNTDASGTRSPQRNVVLSEDSNQVINTGEDGLDGGVVGVYVIDGENKAILNGHGIEDTPFGTFGDEGHAHPSVFLNDRNPALRAVSKSSEDELIYWDEVICKLTDDSDTLLYKAVEITVKGVKTTLYAPAVYKTLKEGFEASEGTLYYMDGTRFDNDSLKVKMLKDYSLSEKHTAPVKRTVTLTTAEIAIDPEKTLSDGDMFTFATDRTEDRERAHLTRTFAADSMMAVNSGSKLAVTDIVFDGNKSDTDYAVTANGGIMFVGARGILTIADGATLQDSATTGKGGAVYAADGASVAMTGGEITDNEAGVGGAGIYLVEGSTLKLEGSPEFSENTVTDTDNYPGDPVKTNGGEKIYTDGKLRQDIFLAGYLGKISSGASAQAKPATAIIVTGNITSKAGSIWVWPEKPEGDQPDNHYEMLKQFAVVEKGKTLSAASYLAFRNALEDDVTLCGAEYLTGEAGDEMIDTEGTSWKTIRWKGGGFDFSFKKIDGFGKPLPGASFRLYKGYTFEKRAQAKVQTLTEPLMKGTDFFEATSSDGTAKNSRDETIDKGIVLFEKAPQGIYYILESDVPDGCLKITEDDESSVIYTKETESSSPNKALDVGPTIYVVLLGEAALTIPDDKTGSPWADVLSRISETDIRKQTGTGENAKNYALFKIDPETGRAVAEPDIAAFGIMNVSTAERKVILRKTVEDKYTPLDGAKFRIFRADLSEITDTDFGYDSAKKCFISLASGVYFIGKLPEGKYYLVETAAPSGAAANNAGKVFTLEVKDGMVKELPGSDTDKIDVSADDELLENLQNLVLSQSETTADDQD